VSTRDIEEVSMKMCIRSVVAGAVFLSLGSAAVAGEADKKLDVTWVDVEGGAATLMVTPAGETILFDTGYPGDRDAERIKKAVTEAGAAKIDHLIITHFHADHFGGLSDIIKRVPVGTLYERDLDKAPDREKAGKDVPQYKQAQVDKRVRIKPGDSLKLKQAPGAAKLAVQFLGMDEKFISGKGARDNRQICKDKQTSDPDGSDNRNSVVTLVSFGPFRFFEGGDLTWNTEGALVCPKNRVGGPIDVFQTNHHGMDNSNNPVLIKSLAPTVTVVNNGPRKGGDPNTFAALKATSSIQAIYQVHRNVRLPAEQNTAPDLTANQNETCEGNHVKLTVEPDGKKYALAVPATKHEKTYETRAKR
jgi:beta-lactamase superfamily II metal-dependent hydrolase